jgi:NAD(P)-dependent dehydrogenase (short-subunit alcohol dehydrogenase family)
VAEPSSYTLVTGAASGIGRAIAVRLSAERRLILHDLNGAGLEESRRQCATPDRHLAWRFDLREIEQLGPGLSALLLENHASVECFIHCAGIVTILPARSVDHNTAKDIMAVNFLSALDITSILLKKRINGMSLRNIVFISSLSSKFGTRGHSLYCASKGALDSYMKALAVELAPQVRVNSVLPGAIETPLTVQAMSDAAIATKWKRDYLLGLGKPEYIVDMVEFLVSDKARWITGQQVVVDGGWTAEMSLK